MAVSGICMTAAVLYGRPAIKNTGAKKINRNIERDAENHRILSEQGWKVLVIWECQIKKKVADENLENLYTAVTQ